MTIFLSPNKIVKLTTTILSFRLTAFFLFLQLANFLFDNFLCQCSIDLTLVFFHQGSHDFAHIDGSLSLRFNGGLDPNSGLFFVGQTGQPLANQIEFGLFGCGSILDAHTDPEKVELRAVESCAARHVRTVRDLLATL